MPEYITESWTQSVHDPDGNVWTTSHAFIARGLAGLREGCNMEGELCVCGGIDSGYRACIHPRTEDNIHRFRNPNDLMMFLCELAEGGVEVERKHFDFVAEAITRGQDETI